MTSLTKERQVIEDDTKSTASSSSSERGWHLGRFGSAWVVLGMELGKPVWVRRRGQPLLKGEVAYTGPVDFSSGDDWVGIRLIGKAMSQGKNNGSVHGTTYFKTSLPKAGLFVRRQAVTLRTTARNVSLELRSSSFAVPNFGGDFSRRISRKPWQPSKSIVYNKAELERLEALAQWKIQRDGRCSKSTPPHTNNRASEELDLDEEIGKMNLEISWDASDRAVIHVSIVGIHEFR